MDQEYKYTFNNLKNELRELSIEKLKSRLEEQQKELMKKTISLMSGSKRRMNYTRETKFNLKKIRKTIAIIRAIIKEKQND